MQDQNFTRNPEKLAEVPGASITLSLRKTSQRIHQFLERKVLAGLFFGYALYAGGICKGDVLVADVEKLETMDGSEIFSKRLNVKE